MSNILEVKDLKVMYGKSVAVHDVNITVPEGKVVTLVGANGAGKSTTLNALLNVVPQVSGGGAKKRNRNISAKLLEGPRSEGTILYQGEDITGLSTSERVKRGLVLAPEGRHLFPYLSVYKNLQLGATLRTDKDGIAEDLEFVYDLFPKLKDRRKQKAGTLSGGEQQMVAIARAMMANPKLLCLDEPSLGLAPVVIEGIGNAIRDINQRKGISVLLVEQNVHLAFGVADYCYALSVGELFAEGTVEEIRKTDAVNKAYFG